MTEFTLQFVLHGLIQLGAGAAIGLYVVATVWQSSTNRSRFVAWVMSVTLGLLALFNAVDEAVRHSDPLLCPTLTRELAWMRNY